METMTRDGAVAAVIAVNPRAKRATVEMYVDAWIEYRGAMTNIREHGSVVFHPRTGSPIDNPYLRVRDSAAKSLERLGAKLKTDELWGQE